MRMACDHCQWHVVFVRACPPCRAMRESSTADEMLEARRWVAAKFEGIQETPLLETGLIVRANNDPVQKNRRANRPTEDCGRRVHERAVLPCGE